MGYRKVYFRIDSKYQFDYGWPDDGNAANAFREETRRLFQGAGWTIQQSRNSAESDTAIKGYQDLYLHPMDFSGVVLDEEIPVLESLFTQAETFRCRGVDRYEEYLDLDDEGYWALLDEKKPDITAAILERFTTSRKNLYITGGAATGIADRFTVHRICDKEDRRDLANLYVSQLINEMLADGRLIAAKTAHGEGIRAATAKELLARRAVSVDMEYLQKLAG